MKKVLFLTRYPLTSKYNLRTKFDGQMQALKRLEYDVWLLAYDDNFIYAINNNKKETVQKIRFAKTKLFYHVLSYLYLYKAALRLLYKGMFSQGDIVYIRDAPKEYLYTQMMHAFVRNNVTTIVEIPTYIKNGGEDNTLFIKTFQWISSIFVKDKYTDLYTVIGDDCEGVYNNKPAVNIDNGVDVDRFKLRNPQTHTGINLIAVASMCEWHGFDRIILGLSEYKGEEDINLYIIGDDGDGSGNQWRELAKTLKVEDKVHFTGPKYGDELSNLFDQSDIAFASLGAYRTKKFNASDLKSREYSARGIPFVYATNDSMLDTHASNYYIKMANDSSSIDIQKIVLFYNRLSQFKNASEEMRQFAEKYMTWDSQFTKVFNKLETIKH